MLLRDALALTIGAAIALVALVALAAPPASQPVAPSVKEWLALNWHYLVFGVLIPSIIAGLKNKGVRKGLIGFFEAVLERASILTPKNSPGTFKWPFAAAKPPAKDPGVAADPTPLPAPAPKQD